MRKKIVAGNWKMNKTPSEAVELVNMLKPLCANEDVDVVFCVPAIDIIPAMEAAKGSNIAIGAENMYYEESGAYTGEISPAPSAISAAVCLETAPYFSRVSFFTPSSLCLASLE